MADRPSSMSGMDEPINVVAQNGQEFDKPSKRNSDLSSEASDQSPPTPAEGDMKRSVTKPPTAKLPLPSDTTDGQPAIRPTFSHLYHSSNTSRSLSTRTSSSSLQALNEDTVIDARSELGGLGRSPLSRRTSYVTQSEPQPTEYPVYPDQSYEVLQSQVHPTYQRPSLWTRGSHNNRSDTQSRYGSRTSRTAGNTPVSSPGLFSFRSRRPTPFGSEDGRVSSPYLHPTHLQPPKEYAPSPPP